MKITLIPLTKSERKNDFILELFLFRHGRTRYNLEKRYQGRTDLPLIDEEYGRIRPFRDSYLSQSFGQSIPADATEGTQIPVYVSPALRARQTAKLLFPGRKQIVVPEFSEMDLGVFEGRSAFEMREDPQYRSWIESMCEDRVPGGESRAQFTSRVAGRFASLVSQTLQERKRQLLIVAHGGTQMAVMEKFSEVREPYWTWQTEPGGYIYAGVSVNSC